MIEHTWYIRLAKDVLRRHRERVDMLMYPGKSTEEELAQVVIDQEKKLQDMRRALTTVRDLMHADHDGSPRLFSTGERSTFIFPGTADKIRLAVYEALQ